MAGAQDADELLVDGRPVLGVITKAGLGRLAREERPLGCPGQIGHLVSIRLLRYQGTMILTSLQKLYNSIRDRWTPAGFSGYAVQDVSLLLVSSPCSR
jgi:hypothetical protein